ncbi:hypothetical protein NFI96_028661, partial [Prochilodus magdalenae]
MLYVNVSRQVSPAAERLRYILGDDEDAMPTPTLFTEMDTLQHEGEELEWRESARWVKFEEKVEEGGERWSKPHVSTLSLHSLFELRTCLQTGVVLLDLEGYSLPQIVGEEDEGWDDQGWAVWSVNRKLADDIIERQIEEGIIGPELRDKISFVLLRKHRHQTKKPIHRSLADMGKGGSGAPRSPARTPAAPSNFNRSTEDLRCKQGGSYGRLRHAQSRSMNDITDTPSTDQLKNKFMKKIPRDAEASNVLVGEVDFLNKPFVAFVRLAQATTLGGLTEVPVPTRFLFVLLGPPGKAKSYNEIGRAIATLMVDDGCSKPFFPSQSDPASSTSTSETKTGIIASQVKDLPQTGIIASQVRELTQTGIIASQVKDLPQTGIIASQVRELTQTGIIASQVKYLSQTESTASHVKDLTQTESTASQVKDLPQTGIIASQVKDLPQTGIIASKVKDLTQTESTASQVKDLPQTGIIASQVKDLPQTGIIASQVKDLPQTGIIASQVKDLPQTGIIASQVKYLSQTGIIASQVKDLPQTVIIASQVKDLPQTGVIASKVKYLSQTGIIASQVKDLPQTGIIASQVKDLPQTGIIASQVKDLPQTGIIASQVKDLPQTGVIASKVKYLSQTGIIASQVKDLPQTGIIASQVKDLPQTGIIASQVKDLPQTGIIASQVNDLPQTGIIASQVKDLPQTGIIASQVKDLTQTGIIASQVKDLPQTGIIASQVKDLPQTGVIASKVKDLPQTGIIASQVKDLPQTGIIASQVKNLSQTGIIASQVKNLSQTESTASQVTDLPQTEIIASQVKDLTQTGIIASQVRELTQTGIIASQLFSDVAYKARDREDLIAGIDEFLDEVIVLPPGEWDPKIRIEPPKKVTSADKRRSVFSLNELGQMNGSVGGGGGVSEDEEMPVPHELGEELAYTGRQVPLTPLPDFTHFSGKPSRASLCGWLCVLCRFCGGLFLDIKRKLPWYPSDFYEGFHIQSISAVLFIYLGCITNAITFGGLLGDATDNYQGVMESFLGTALAGTVFCLFGGQPLIILSSTGPILIFEKLLYEFSKSNSIDYMELRLWIGMHSCVQCLFLVATDTSYIIKYMTRFTEEGFSSLISFIFISDAIKKMVGSFKYYPINTDFKPDYVTAYKCECVAPDP